MEKREKLAKMWFIHNFLHLYHLGEGMGIAGGSNIYLYVNYNKNLLRKVSSGTMENYHRSLELFGHQKTITKFQRNRYMFYILFIEGKNILIKKYSVCFCFVYLLLDDGKGDLCGAGPLDHVTELALPVEHLEIEQEIPYMYMYICIPYM